MSEPKEQGRGASDLCYVLDPLVEAAEKHAVNYIDNPRQDIRCKVLNAFYAGAKYAEAAERERWGGLVEDALNADHGDYVLGSDLADRMRDALKS